MNITKKEFIKVDNKFDEYNNKINESFEYIEGNEKIMISAPHSVRTSFLIAEIVSLAIIFPPITACKGIVNKWRGITVFNFSIIFLPLSYAESLCTIKLNASTLSPFTYISSL